MSLVNSLKNIINFKFGMAFGPAADFEMQNMINQALLQVNAEKTYNKRVAEFFSGESIPLCEKSSLIGRDSYK
jgi:hypothetical protein